MRALFTTLVGAGALSLLATGMRPFDSSSPSTWTTREGITTRSGDLAPLREHDYFDVHGAGFIEEGHVVPHEPRCASEPTEVRRGDYVEPPFVR